MSMRTMSVCLVGPLAATMTSHSRMGLPYVASMLRIWAWSPSSTVAMVRRSFGSGEALFEQGALGGVGSQAERALVGQRGLGLMPGLGWHAQPCLATSIWSDRPRPLQWCLRVLS